MLTEQRHQEILNLLEQDGSVKARDLCGLFDSSRETVRRDLETMEAQGMLRRIHGGAMRVDSAQAESYTPFVDRANSNLPYKEVIAKEALNYISEGQSIALDSGSTSLVLAKLIKDHFQSLTVVTNSLAVANELANSPGITLVMTGGVYRPEEEAFESDIATLIFSKLNIDIFFLTTCGISVERGITYQRMDEVFIQNAILGASEQVIVIADSSKLGVNSLVKMCGIEETSMLITDSDASQEQIDAFQNAGIPVVLANKENI